MTNTEKRFLEVINFQCNLHKFPLEKEDCPQVKNDKEKSNMHGEVFTPLWFVDNMILKSSDNLKIAKHTIDLCAGYGQFTIRMLRFLINNVENFDEKSWLKEVHSFSEYQLSSSCKLLYVFGTDINLFIGDAQQLYKLEEEDEGVLLYSEETKKWSNVTKNIQNIFINIKGYSKELEESFVEEISKKDIRHKKLIFRKFLFTKQIGSLFFPVFGGSMS